MINRIKLIIPILLMVLVSSCNDDDDNSGPIEPVADGILLINEGNFGQGNASISALSLDLSEVQNNYYQGINGSPLGDTAQSMAFIDDLVYIVVNVSQKIEVVNRTTFESVATITTGLSNPRYMTFSNGKGFVTNWGDGTDPNDDFVAVINLDTQEVESTISVPEGPEELVSYSGNIYVAHQGGFSQNNVVSVIDANTESQITTITVADVPNSLIIDNSGSLWVLCGGKQAWTGDETAGALYNINIASNSIEDTFTFAVDEHPNFLKLNDNVLIYTLNGGIFEFGINETMLPDTPEIDGLTIYNMSLYNNTLYTTDAVDFVSNGTLRSYDINNDYLLSNSVQTRIIPGEIYFD